MEVEPDPAPTPGRFKSWVQLKAWASYRFPRATLVTEGLDLKAWNRIAPILNGLASDWPGVAHELGWITTRHALWEDDPRYALAAADSLFGEKIALNPFFFAKPKRIVKVLAYGESVGLYPTGAKDAREWYVLSHEWGHLVYAWLRRHDQDRLGRLTGLFAITTGDHPVAFDTDKGAAISEYAKRRLTDAFAEAFSPIQWQQKGKWPDIVQQFSRILGGEP